MLSENLSVLVVNRRPVLLEPFGTLLLIRHGMLRADRLAALFDDFDLLEEHIAEHLDAAIDRAEILRQAIFSPLALGLPGHRVLAGRSARVDRQFADDVAPPEPGDLTDPRERLHDIDDLSNRLLRLLSGGAVTAAAGNLPQDTILIARTMGPAELLDYDRQRLRGLVLEEGGSASHVAIVARALGIASISQVKGVLDMVEAGDAAIVDAEGGELHIRPTHEVVSAYADKVRFRARRQAQYAALRTVPSVTLDGERVAIHINAGLLFDLPHLDQSGADGIGLFRTELQFMISATFPRLACHFRTRSRSSVTRWIMGTTRRGKAGSTI